MLSVELTGLTRDTLYYYQVMVTNTAGSTTSTAPPATFIIYILRMFSTMCIHVSYNYVIKITGSLPGEPVTFYTF